MTEDETRWPGDGKSSPDVSCASCRMFSERVSEAPPPGSSPWDIVRAVNEGGDPWSGTQDASMARHHPRLERLVDRELGSPEGVGATFRCTECGARWEMFAWMLFGGETARRL